MLLGLAFLVISTVFSSYAEFVIASERVVVPTISLFEIPTFSVAFSAPPLQGEGSLLPWIAEQVESGLYVLFFTLHVVGGVLAVFGSMMVVAGVTLRNR